MLFRPKNPNLYTGLQEPREVSCIQIAGAESVNDDAYIYPSLCRIAKRLCDGITNGVIGIQIGFETDGFCRVLEGPDACREVAVAIAE